MSTKNELYTGVSKAAWAYFFLYFDFNVSGISVLPSFVCYLLILSAIRLLSGERRDLLLLRPLCVILALWNIGDWLMSWVGRDLDGQVVFLDLIIGAIGIYFHFQLFTDFAALAAQYQGPEEHLDQRILNWRTIQTVLLTIIAVWTSVPHMALTWADSVVLMLALIGLIAGLCLMAALFSLRKLFADDV